MSTKRFEFPEKQTVIYQVKLVDELDRPVHASEMVSITATLFLADASSYTAIGSWSSRDVFNSNEGTYGATDGQLTVTFGPTDMTMIDQARSRERHMLELEFTYGSPVKTGRHQVLFILQNYGSVS